MSGAEAQRSASRADAAAWLAVAAGTIGALMATLDTSIVNSGLPTIQGEIGASSSEGTWISTAYLVAEIVMIPLAGWFQNIFGLRTFLLAATTLFTLFSIWCGASHDLIQMIIGRIGQGFSGGAMIPTALTIIGLRLPPKQQPIGVALFGMTAVLGPVLGPVIGGWLTENVSWHYAFFLNLPIGIGLLALLVIGLPSEKTDWGEFRNTDVLGILGLVLGLGGMTIVLEEGQRSLWFQSALIRDLTGISLSGFALLVIGQFVATKPVIQLKILLRRSFAGVFLISLMVGAVMYGVLYIIPQFLTAVQGYNAEQSGLVAAISGVPTLILLGAFPLLVRVIDMRVAIAAGLILYGVSCLMDAGLTPLSSGPQFVLTQVLRGAGTFFAYLFLNQAATNSVARDLTEDASGLFNAARNLGGSFGLAMVATLQEGRTNFHFARLAESLSANSLPVQDQLRAQGLPAIDQALRAQATVMTYADLYWVFALASFLMIPLVLLLKPLAADAEIGLA